MIMFCTRDARAVLPIIRESVWPGFLRMSFAAVGLMAVLALGACAINPVKDGDAASPAQSAEPLSEFMDRARAAKVAGGGDSARLIYREAAAAYPTDKRPWLSLAQSYFDAADYANAILAAQEVVQRDSKDTVALGLLAVSGLRVSTAAFSTLRSLGDLPASTRSEAADMARNLRTITGESVLVPKPVEGPSGLARTVRPKSPNPGSPAATAVPPPGVKAQPQSKNPFGALN